MQKTILGLALAAVLAAAGSSAAQQVYGDTARVISATPIHERVPTHRRECRTETISAYEERRGARPEGYREAVNDGIGPGAVLGAIIGGVIGHQFGNSSGGRDHGTAAGAVIGGLIGNSIERDTRDDERRPAYVERVPVTRDVQRCDDIADATERIVGYDVRYEYNGREFRARMPFDPGKEMPVNIEVRPPGARDPIAGPRTPNYRGTF